MATRDTIIDVVDRRTGHTARIKVPVSVLERALSDDYDPCTARPSAAMRGAQNHICMQAKEAMAKKGRRQSFLAWGNIVDSVRSSDQVPARGTSSDASVSTTYMAAHPELQPDNVAVYPETPLNHQGRLFNPDDMLIRR